MNFRVLPGLLLTVLLTPFAVAEPLFDSDDPLEITIEMPLDQIIKEAESKPEVPGIVRFTDADGSKVEIEMTMTTRGRSRLAYCFFPPLKINLKKGQTEGNVFEGQNKLKLVTRCRDSSTYERYLRQEFGIYKAYNELTDYSYRARWVTVNYVDSLGKRKDESHDGFFIESSGGIARRLGRERATENRISPSKLNPVESNKYEVFQYLIANTDWSMIKGPGDEGCCHNGKVLVPTVSDDGYVVLPYDFDQAGLMNTRYAMPSPALGIRSVRQRIYRGRCRHNAMLDDTIKLFNDKRDLLEQHLVPNELSDHVRKKSSKYIASFYKIVNDPAQRQRYILEKCIGS